DVVHRSGTCVPLGKLFDIDHKKLLLSARYRAMKPISHWNLQCFSYVKNRSWHLSKGCLGPHVNVIKCGPHLPLESTSQFQSDISSCTLYMAHIPPVPHRVRPYLLGAFCRGCRCIPPGERSFHPGKPEPSSQGERFERAARALNAPL